MFRKIVKFFIPTDLFRKVEPYGHLAEAMLWQAVYGFPARNLKVIGVTGTDGKTTTTTLIWKMLENAGKKVGYMTSVGYGTSNWHKANYTHMTTMQTRGLLQRVRELKRDGIEWLVLETSSNALGQNRVAGIPYQIAVMTNVTSDHLDYHGTLERYRDAKRRLFTMAAKHGIRGGVANADNPLGIKFAAEVPNPVTYGIKNGDLRAVKIKLTPVGSTFEAHYQERNLRVTTNMPGDFNVYNALAAIGTGILVGLADKQIEDGVAALAGVEGRMNIIDEGQDFTVIVDFASTPGGFEAVLPSTKKSTTGRLIVMFGSAGRRDEAKRAVQGRIAGKYADIVVVTEEDDRDVDGHEIMDQIADGAQQERKVRDKDLFLILNRAAAVKFAISQARKGDTVMLLGKGHEKMITRADGDHPWDEVAEARKAIKAVQG